MGAKTLVLDANILIRAVLGTRVRHLLFEHRDTAQFFAPDTAYAEARKYLPGLLRKRGVEGDAALQVLAVLEDVVHPLAFALYASWQPSALQRIAARDADDWPVLACAMALGCPVWTEDADFFGTGIATWTTDRIALYLA